MFIITFLSKYFELRSVTHSLFQTKLRFCEPFSALSDWLNMFLSELFLLVGVNGWLFSGWNKGVHFNFVDANVWPLRLSTQCIEYIYSTIRFFYDCTNSYNTSNRILQRLMTLNPGITVPANAELSYQIGLNNGCPWCRYISGWLGQKIDGRIVRFSTPRGDVLGII